MKNKKLLIIDDDPDVRDSLKVILESHGFIVDTASNKNDGLKLFSSKKPDLIILDIMMENDLDGFGMLVDLKKGDSNADVPVIMYTGMAKQMGVNFRSAVEDKKMFPRVSFVDKREDVKYLVQKVKEALKK